MLFLSRCSHTDKWQVKQLNCAKQMTRPRMQMTNRKCTGNQSRWLEVAGNHRADAVVGSKQDGTADWSPGPHDGTAAATDWAAGPQ